MAIPRGINQTQPITQRAYIGHKIALYGIQSPREDHGLHKNKDGEYELRNMGNYATRIFKTNREKPKKKYQKDYNS